jgi:hypothetical protein
MQRDQMAREYPIDQRCVVALPIVMRTFSTARVSRTNQVGITLISVANYKNFSQPVVQSAVRFQGNFPVLDEPCRRG